MSIKYKDDTSEVIFGCVGLGVLAAALIVMLTISSGWVLSILWAWFVVPVFKLPVLSIAQAIGLTCVFGLFRGGHNSSNSKSSDDKQKNIGAILRNMVSPFFLLGFGWIVRQWL